MTASHGFGGRVGGALCLDFVNTVRGRIPGGDARDAVIVGERLASYDDLVRWAGFAELVTTRQAKVLAAEAARRPARSATVLRRAVAAREAMYRLCRGAIAGWPARPDDLSTLHRELQIARAHDRLVASPPGLALEAGAPGTALDGVLWPVVRSAVELLTSARLARLGQCPGDTCGWLFLDTSRSGRRQWCDMKACGNVAKVRRFRDKAREAPAATRRW